MRIQHNILAMNAYRNYNTNTSALAKNLEKLSSGYKINRAGDDAAGLAISEKMRAQITGLSAAQKNVKDGISLVKTAEGAMQEIQDMLNRMDYLATQSANGTYDNEVDRLNLNKEVIQLKSEINRIADSANFNGIKLLDGSLDANSSVSSDTSAMRKAEVTPEIDGMKAPEEAQKGIYTIDLKGLKLQTASKASGTVTIKIGSKTVGTVKVTGSNAIHAAEKKGDVKAFTVTAAKGTITISGVKFTVATKSGNIQLTMKENPASATAAKVNMEVAYSGSGVSKYTAGASDEADNEQWSNNAWTDSVRVDQVAIFAPQRVLASASFDLADIANGSRLADGMQVKIGDTTYTFAVGKDSKYTNVKGAVDLSKVSDSLDDDELMVEAARRLTKAAAENASLKVTTTNTSSIVHLTEIEDKIDYAVNDLMGNKKDLDGDWEGLVMFGQADPSIATATGGLILQIGDTAESYNQLRVSIGSMYTKDMVAQDGSTIEGLDISTPEGAQKAIQTIKDAINYVSGVRGDLGATQNRLEHTANNLSVMAENIQDAESTIRDTDIAEEMMAYTKNNILVQSAQAMLAQANAVPQGVLQLLG